MDKNISIHISDRSHINLTLNVYNCGNQGIEMEHVINLDHYALYYVHEGVGYVTMKQATHKVKAGEGFVVYPNQEARIKSAHKKGLNVSWVAFSGYLVERYLSRAKLSCYEPVFYDTEERELEAIFATLIRVSKKLPNRYCKIMAQMYTMFSFLLDHARYEAQNPVSTPEYVIIRALDFIDSNYHDDITVEDIAASVGSNRKSLYTVFKNMTGFSPRDYLIYYRVCKATSILKDRNIPVKVVATSVGYSDEFQFSKVFKKTVGMSPSEYRKVVLQDPSKEFLSPIDTVRQQFPENHEEAPLEF